jgi:hypothetical protein
MCVAALKILLWVLHLGTPSCRLHEKLGPASVPLADFGSTAICTELRLIRMVFTRPQPWQQSFDFDGELPILRAGNIRS